MNRPCEHVRKKERCVVVVSLIAYSLSIKHYENNE